MRDAARRPANPMLPRTRARATTTRAVGQEACRLCRPRETAKGLARPGRCRPPPTQGALGNGRGNHHRLRVAEQPQGLCESAL